MELKKKLNNNEEFINNIVKQNNINDLTQKNNKIVKIS